MGNNSEMLGKNSLAECTWEELRRSWIPWLQADLKIPYAEIWREFQLVRHRMVKHRASYGRGWQSLTLHGLGPEHTEGAEHYPGFENFNDSTAPMRWTEIADQCEVTTRFLKSLPYSRFFRVRFMLLEPRGEISLHRDTEHPNLSPLNIAIRHPENCHFDMYHGETKEYLGRVPFVTGRGFFVNIGTLHQVKNESDEDRLHIIVHGVHSKEFYRRPSDFFVSP